MKKTDGRKKQMAHKDNSSNNPLSFKEESNLKNRISVFHDRLKRHLSGEYLFLNERKDALESELVEMKFELEQKDKKLFKSNDQRDTRQYFSPLNLVSIDESHKDERVKQLTSDVKRIQGEIDQYDRRLKEIHELLAEIDRIHEAVEEKE